MARDSLDIITLNGYRYIKKKVHIEQMNDDRRKIKALQAEIKRLTEKLSMAPSPPPLDVGQLLHKWMQSTEDRLDSLEEDIFI